MIDLVSISEDRLSQTMRSIRQHIIIRNWNATVPYIGSAHCFITRDDGKIIHLFSATPPTTSYAAAHLANDKFATYKVLELTDIPQPSTIMTNESSNLDEPIEFMKSCGRVVVKPVDGGHGKGITVNVSTEAELKDAISIATKATKGINSVLVQQQYSHDAFYEVRILCIDYKYVAAIQRVAARVFGDNIHTILELIEIENLKETRGRPYYARLAVISAENATLYLKERVHDVPVIGEEVQVLGVANYGAGGETIDVTDNIPDWLIEFSEKASRACELPVSGVDFIIATLPEKKSTTLELDAQLIEINKCPLLTMHDSPTSGISRNVVACYMDYLASLV